MELSWLKSHAAVVALFAIIGGANVVALTAVPLSTPAQALTADQQAAIQAQVAAAISAWESASDAELQTALDGVVAQILTQYSGQDLIDALAEVAKTAELYGAAGIAANAIIDGASPEIAGAALGKAATELSILHDGGAQAIAQAVANSGSDALIVAFSEAAPAYADIAEGNPRVEGQDDQQNGDTAGGSTPPPCANPSCV